MKNQFDNYDNLLDIERIMDVYHTIRINTKNKNKLLVYEMFFSCNLFSIYETLKNKCYRHGKYNIFLLKMPKYRVIMSEQMSDKIIDHLISKYVLYPILEPKLIPMNVATRSGMGTEKGIFYVKKYIHHLKFNHDKFYVLKCDISKYFYSIDHEILFSKLKKEIHDPDILALLSEFIHSTDCDYINATIDKIVEREIQKLENRGGQEEQIKQLRKVARYEKGKGLPIGNMISQILAIYYLNDLDHFIKEKLHIKCYVRYMDDFILMHEDRDYLKYCYGEIKKKIGEEKLSFNEKTQFVEIHHGFVFLGYRFVLKGKKLLILLRSQNKRKIRRRIKSLRKHHPENEENILASYTGYLKRAHSGSFCYRNGIKISKNKKV